MDIILGAGPAGLAASYFNHHKNCSIYEKNETYGGLCGSLNINGFVFDKAVHLSFSNNSTVKDLFNKTPLYNHAPEAVNYFEGIWIRHPVQTNLFPLPSDVKKNIIDSYKNRDINVNPLNYEEFLINSFGYYFYKMFPYNYTIKYWTVKPKELSTNWCESRIYQPTVEELQKSCNEENKVNNYYAKQMRYPKVGGFKSFLSVFADDATIFYNKEAVNINPGDKTITFQDGSKVKYDKLFSSIPLPELVDIVKAPPNIINKAKELKYTSMLLVSIGVEEEIKFDPLWFYVYDLDIPFCRGYITNNKSNNNAPIGKTGIQVEIPFSTSHPLTDSIEVIEGKVIKCLISMGILNTITKVEFVSSSIEKYANVIYYNGMENARDMVLDYIQKIGLIPIGRFGKWEYLWSDQAIMSSYDAVNK